MQQSTTECLLMKSERLIWRPGNPFHSDDPAKFFKKQQYTPTVGRKRTNPQVRVREFSFLLTKESGKNSKFWFLLLIISET